MSHFAKMDTVFEEKMGMQVDCVSWSKLEKDTLAVGAYHLDRPDSSERSGRVYILKVEKDVSNGYKLAHEFHTEGGVLDLKYFCPQTTPNDKEVLIVACSSGLYIYQTDDFSCTRKLSGSMALYISTTPDGNILYSDAEGHVNLISVLNEELCEKVKIHDSLTWTVGCFDNVVYAGDDFGTFTFFKLEDFRTVNKHNSMKFTMGVVSVISHNQLVLVGSYDDHLHLFRRSICTNGKVVLDKLSKLFIGAAPWRLEIIRSDRLTIAAACARKGIQIFGLDHNTERKMNVLWTFNKYNDLLAYGLSVKRESSSGPYWFATGYYDNHIVHVFSLSEDDDF